jgi:hypothetical protein
MIKGIAFLTGALFLILTSVYVPHTYAQGMVSEKIPSEATAEEIKDLAQGQYWRGESIPVHKANEVALPVLDEKTGKVIGHIIADKQKLIDALNIKGYTTVASALAAVETGTSAGLAAGTTLSTGTIVGLAAGAVAITTIVLIVIDDDGVTTTHHH